MKKAKSFRRVLISILLLACLFLPLYQLKADSGFDGAYDSGHLPRHLLRHLPRHLTFSHQAHYRVGGLLLVMKMFPI